MRTNAPYTVNFKHYGEITVPAGVRLTHMTASGKDEDYHFVAEFGWIDTCYPLINNILKHDMTYSGLNVPKEYVDYEGGK